MDSTAGNRPDTARDAPKTAGTLSMVAAPVSSLPKGGGAIAGSGETFTANSLTGSGSLSIPIAMPAGRGGFSPVLSLSYDSGGANGVFGVGWTLGLGSVRLRTDKGLPRYDDDPEHDIFALTPGEDLVPIAVSGADFDDLTSVTGFAVRRYRPRVEGSHQRIERWRRLEAPDDTHWRVWSADNVLTLYGTGPESRLTDGADTTRIFAWLPRESRDDKGSVVFYDYRAENDDGVDVTAPHESNRNSAARAANRHLKSIRYGNVRPVLGPDGKRSATLTDAERTAVEFHFEVVLDYGEHDAKVPKPGDTGSWTPRLDPFSSFRAGFELRCQRLCRRVLVFHHFRDEPGVGDDCLVHSLQLHYTETPAATFLSAVEPWHHRRLPEGGYLSKPRPKLEFDYSPAVLGEKIETIDAESAENLPPATGHGAGIWVDLDGDGLSGLLTERAGGWLYKRNLSPIAPQRDDESWPVQLGTQETVAPIPGHVGPATPGWRLVDIDGDGVVELVDTAAPEGGFFHRTGRRGWERFSAFGSQPNIHWDDPNLRLIDLTGDGRPDLMVASDDVLFWHPALGVDGYAESQQIAPAIDEEAGPRVIFADLDQSIFLADFSGDGLTDIARVRNGEVCYWPNLGHGRFGAKVTMDAAPDFGADFEPRRVRLADIDGSGPTDLIYLGADAARCWFNQSGNGWSAINELPHFPATDDAAVVTVLDLLGNGTSSLVWQSGTARDTAQLRCLPLMAAGKPHLLVGVRNNLGAETRISYAPSTKFYLKDQQAGVPWLTTLPYPVQVVERVETIDHISASHFVACYSYHHGHYDAV
ncbi:MAG: SpvB/TcaC N-terminal domain-containing protein, partial [Devosia sp.]